jgi:hypothetical protein
MTSNPNDGYVRLEEISKSGWLPSPAALEAVLDRSVLDLSILQSDTDASLEAWHGPNCI